MKITAFCVDLISGVKDWPKIFFNFFGVEINLGVITFFSCVSLFLAVTSSTFFTLHLKVNLIDLKGSGEFDVSIGRVDGRLSHAPHHGVSAFHSKA